MNQPRSPNLTAGLAKLTTAEALELATCLSQAAASGAPLPVALRAAAAHGISSAQSAAVEQLAAAIEAGATLDEAVGAIAPRLPPRTRDMISAGARSGRLAETLEQVLAEQRVIDTLDRQFWQAITYPAVLLAILAAWMLFVSMWIVPGMDLAGLLDDFEGIDRPSAVQPMDRLVEFSTVAPRALVALAVAVALGVIVTWLVGGTAGLSRLAACLPLVGRAWWYRGLAEFSGLLSVFLAQGQTLPEALRLIAQAARDPAVRRSASRMATASNRGTDLAVAMQGDSLFPPLLMQLASWGQQHHVLGPSLTTCRELYVARFASQARLVHLIVPPAVVLAVAGVALLVASVFSNLLTLLIDLLSWNPSASPSQVARPPELQLSGVASLLVLGASLTFASSLLAMLAPGAATALRGVLRFCGLVLAYLGVTACCALLPPPVAVIAWLVVNFIWARAAIQLRNSERQNLMAAITLAADQKQPLPAVIVACAAEFGAGMAVDSRLLAIRLEAGTPLVDAVLFVPGVLPAEARLAAKVGGEAGNLSAALRAARTNPLFDRTLLRPLLLRLMYVMAVLLFVVVFLQIKIAPSMAKIFADFDLPLPPISQLVMSNTQFVVSSTYHPHYTGWNVTPLHWVAEAAMVLGQWLAPLVILVGLPLSVFVWLQWWGTLQPRLPWLGPIIRWLDMAPVLRLLAFEADQGRQVGTLGNIARLHPKPAVRARLLAVERDINDGVPWTDSLRRRRVVGSADLAVLAAALRAGNLPWALRETADSMERRATYRLRAASELLTPLLMLPVALVAAVFIIGYLAPLPNLIWSLSQ